MHVEIKPVSVPSSCTHKQPVQMEAVYDWPMYKSGGSTSSYCPDTSWLQTPSIVEIQTGVASYFN